MNSNRAQTGHRLSQTLWERAAAVFIEAVGLPLDEREAFLSRACATDEALRMEVESLLAHDVLANDRCDDGLQHVFQSAAAVLLEGESLVGERIGPYLIKSELGHGGMGVVYRAVRADDEYRKQVAIKVVRRGMDSGSMLERFRYERQILANLDHPYIARLLDGGSTEDQQPFFVMEFVEGEAVDHYCRQAGIGVNEICRLFLRVCEAVGYAHRNLVIHRDLKPSNILVTADGTPKLLDFGVAKLLDTEERQSGETGILQRRLTPEYASPEQVCGQPVNTATDVYSLGAVLYELLTGARIHEIKSNTPSEWEQAICRSEIARPSSRRRELRGDLDNILLMALRKEPERRYRSVEEFSSDIQRFLEHMPVVARKDSYRYRASKYLRRHRVGIAAAGLVAASLLIGTGLALSKAHEAQEARKVAEQQRARAEERSRQADEARLISEREHAAAEEQRAIAVKQAGVARSQQLRAQQRLTQMVELANKSLMDVHYAIQRLPGATAARHKIVESTLDYLKSLEKDAANDSDLQLVLAGAYLRMGQIQGSPFSASLGDSAGAMKSYLRGEEWLRPLLRARPRDPEILSVWIDLESGRAELLNVMGKHGEEAELLLGALPFAMRLGHLSRMESGGREANIHQMLVSTLQSDHPDQAIEHARLSDELFRKLMKANPDDQDNPNALAAVNSLWAATLLPTDPQGALEHYRESARLREALVKAHPDNSAARRGLMLAYRQIAGALGDSFQITPGNDIEGARSYYSKAEKMAHELAAADPANRTAQYDVAYVELRIGALDPVSGGEAESLARLQRARDSFEELLKTDPQSVRYLSPLALAHEYVGIRLSAAGKITEALAELKASLVVADRALALNATDLNITAQSIATERELGSLLAGTGDRDGADEASSQGVARAERFSRMREIPAARILLAKAYAGRAEVLGRIGKWQQAREAAAHSAELWRNVVSGRQADVHAGELTRTQQLIAECDSHLQKNF